MASMSHYALACLLRKPSSRSVLLILRFRNYSIGRVPVYRWENELDVPENDDEFRANLELTPQERVRTMAAGQLCMRCQELQRMSESPGRASAPRGSGRCSIDEAM